MYLLGVSLLDPAFLALLAAALLVPALLLAPILRPIPNSMKPPQQNSTEEAGRKRPRMQDNDMASKGMS